MPELPEVETVMRGMAATLTGAVITSVEARRPDLRWPLPPDFCTRLEGQRITGFRRRAKYVLTDLSGGEVWLTHLGMSGRVTIAGNNAPLQKHDHIIMDFDNGQRLIYNDPRRFGAMDIFPAEEEPHNPRLTHLGPEPLSEDFDAGYLHPILKSRKRAIKELLFDAGIVVGLGNIYIAEALYHAGIRPQRKANRITRIEAEKLVAAIKSVLTAAIASGGSSLRDYRAADGNLGYFQHEWAVYGRAGEACPGCSCGGKQEIRRITQGGRSSFYCPVRQV